MKPNVIINRDGLFEVTANLKIGCLLIHQDFPLGLAMRDFEKGDTLEYDANSNTKDVAIKAEWIWEADETLEYRSLENTKDVISKSPPSHPFFVLDLGKTLYLIQKPTKGVVN